VEEFIERTYASSYDATIARHYPTLMNVCDMYGHIVAAAGLRLAADESLFLETYLDAPVDQVLQRKIGHAVGREKIVEIGNLASSGRGASVFLFITLAAYLRQHKLDYAVVTATGALRRWFAIFGFDVIDLGGAKPDALPDKGASWGRYYSTDPKVVAGAIAPAFDLIEAFLPAAHNSDLDRLFTRFHPARESSVQ
jgi:hypothetical protein